MCQDCSFHSKGGCDLGFALDKTWNTVFHRHIVGCTSIVVKAWACLSACTPAYDWHDHFDSAFLFYFLVFFVLFVFFAVQAGNLELLFKSVLLCLLLTFEASKQARLLKKKTVQIVYISCAGHSSHRDAS